MSLPLLPCDGVDLSLLVRAATKAATTTVRQLGHDRLRSLAEKEGLDFATAVLYERTRREYAACAARIDDLYGHKPTDVKFDNVAFVYVPNLAFFADPKSQAVGTTICQVAEQFGCRSNIVPTSATRSLQENGRLVCESIAACAEKSVILVSVSKGSADVKMALQRSDVQDVFSKVIGWIDVCGLSDGSPLVNALSADVDGRLEKQIKHWFRNRGVPYVQEVLVAAKELGHGTEFPLNAPLVVPPHMLRLNVVGFPTSRHFTFEGSRAFHQIISPYGPNDGYGLLRDMVAKPGPVYPIWGTDHYFEAHLDVERLVAALLAYFAERFEKARELNPHVDRSSPNHVELNSEAPANSHRVAPIPQGKLKNQDDWARLRHARDRHKGFQVGRYLQPAPMLFSRDGHNVFLGDMYRGHSAFLIAGGPSLNSHDLAQLDQRGILTCAVNNAAAVYRPRLWVSVDDPGNFVDAIWQDPGILKFVPLCHMEKHFMVRNEVDELVPSQDAVGDLPAVFGFRRNEQFREEQWLYEDTFNWGNHSQKHDSDGNKGSRSVMYVAIRLLFYLGIRRLFMIGCDFRMEHGGQNYAFSQDRTRNSVRGNNDSYRILNQRLERLRPYFEREGFQIINCTPNSGLTVFPYLPFEAAIDEARAHMPSRINTVGMYDRQQRKRNQAKQGAETLPGIAGDSRDNADPTVPEMTLVTAVDHQLINKLALTWPTWMQHKPGLATMPIVVIHDDSINPQGPRCDFLREHPAIRFVRWAPETNGHTRESLQEALVFVPAREIDTPWYLRLAPETVAVDNSPWSFAKWFAPDVDNRTPACIASPWGYTKPADAIEQLDEWGNSVPGLCEKQALGIYPEVGADRVLHPRIVSWCFIGNSQWTRELAAYAGDHLPCASHDTFVSYCAARRGDLVVRFDMESCGWRHVSGSERRLRRVCEQALGAALV